jgi:hypothetical protein
MGKPHVETAVQVVLAVLMGEYPVDAPGTTFV